MKIRFLRNCAVGGKHQAAGTVAEFDRPTAITLINHRRAELVEDTKAEAPVIQQREPDIETRDPEVADTKPRNRKAKGNG